MGLSNSIYYEDFNKSQQNDILSEFINKYSDENICSLKIKRGPTNNYLILLTENNIQFKDFTNMINFIEKLKRPYVMIRNDDSADIQFVYNL